MVLNYLAADVGGAPLPSPAPEGEEPLLSSPAPEGEESSLLSPAPEGEEPLLPSPAPEGEEPLLPSPTPEGEEPLLPSPAPEGEEPFLPSPTPEGEEPLLPSPTPEEEEPLLPPPTPEGEEPLLPSPAPKGEEPSLPSPTPEEEEPLLPSPTPEGEEPLLPSPAPKGEEPSLPSPEEEAPQRYPEPAEEGKGKVWDDGWEAVARHLVAELCPGCGEYGHTVAICPSQYREEPERPTPEWEHPRRGEPIGPEPRPPGAEQRELPLPPPPPPLPPPGAEQRELPLSPPPPQPGAEQQELPLSPTSPPLGAEQQELPLSPPPPGAEQQELPLSPQPGAEQQELSLPPPPWENSLPLLAPPAEAILSGGRTRVVFGHSLDQKQGNSVTDIYLAPVFALFVPFYCSIPRVQVTQVLGQFAITNKSLVYLVGLQLLNIIDILNRFLINIVFVFSKLLTSSSFMWIIALSGLTSGMLYHKNILKTQHVIFIPNWVAHCGSYTLEPLFSTAEPTLESAVGMGATLDIQRQQRMDRLDQQVLLSQLPQMRRNTQQQVARLMEMGFSRVDALEALRASNNDINIATNFLLHR
ncbi:UNVERIFIED_CONTAM: hypothetical protein FKN15_024444 [Acipenser sinensis]